MEKQETEMKQKLEMETGNENWNKKKHTNHWCNVFFMILVITLVFYSVA